MMYIYRIRESQCARSAMDIPSLLNKVNRWMDVNSQSYVCLCQSINPSMNQSMNPSMNQSIDRSINGLLRAGAFLGVDSFIYLRVEK